MTEKRKVVAGDRICQHIHQLDQNNDGTIEVLATPVTVDSTAAEKVFQMEQGETVMLCDICLRQSRVGIWQQTTKEKIEAETEDPRLVMQIINNFLFSYTGSVFGNKDLVLVSKFTGSNSVTGLYQTIMKTEDINSITEPKVVFVQNSGIKGTVGRTRVRLVPDTLPENHQFYDISTFGNLDKLSIIRIELPDDNNILPGMDGYKEDFDPSNAMTLEEFFNAATDLDSETE